MNIFSSNAQNIERVEPAFWWTGMHQTTFQLMIYGSNISEMTVRSCTKKVKVDKIVKGESPNYLFAYLDLKKAKAGTFQLELKDNDGNLSYLEYTLLDRNPDMITKKGFGNSDVIYLLMPDRFANGNPENDNHAETTENVNRADKGGRHGGDIQGIIDHLDYIQDLGATAIWSTPLLEDNMPVGSYHSYAISDYYKIDPRYGSNEDYKRLAQELHSRNMKLIMDVVPNHCGSEHWWMKDLPFEDWVHQFPKFQRSNYRMTTQLDPYSSRIDNELCEKGWFDISMPDLNQSNPILNDYLAQNAIWWIEYAGLDGLRVDTYSYTDKEGIAKWTKKIRREYPKLNIVGEIWMENQAQIAYWQAGSQVSGNYDSGLPAVMDFTLYNAIQNVFNKDNANWHEGMIQVYHNFVNDFVYPDPFNILVFGENHDTPRLHHVFNGDLRKYKMAMSLILTTRGIPQIFYGSEIAMSGDKNNGDGDLRKDFPGGWPDDKQNAFVESGRTEEQELYHAFTKKMLNWRQNQEVIHSGKLQQFVPSDNIYVYFRYNDESTVMVVINNNQKDIQLDLYKYKERIDGYTTAIDVISESQYKLDQHLNVSSKSALVLELK